MANQPHKFKKRDVRRVVKAARAAGIDVNSVRVNIMTGGRATVMVRPAFRSAAADA